MVNCYQGLLKIKDNLMLCVKICPSLSGFIQKKCLKYVFLSKEDRVLARDV
jgi:hypothetical protein